jgi:predicted ATPase
MDSGSSPGLYMSTISMTNFSLSLFHFPIHFPLPKTQNLGYTTNVLLNTHINNYRRIQGDGLQLRKLVDVNYFVGENGSGKSSILQAIYAYYQSEVFPGLDIKVNPEIIKCHVKFPQKKYQAIYINQDTSSLITYLQDQKFDENKLNSDLFKKYNYLEWSLYTSSFQERNHTNNREKLHYQEYFESLLDELPKDNFYLFLIEEPENFLHPSWEKQLPIIYKELSAKYPCQFFVATHSPYLISSSGEITEEEYRLTLKNKTTYRQSQKVFLIKDGQTSTKSGRTGWSSNPQIQLGSDGYWGKKVSYVAAKLLGAGLSDFVSTVEPHYTSDAPYLIFCEGEGKTEDAQVYNRIFWNHEPRLLFVSSKGVTETQWSFKILEEIKNGLSGNFRTLMLRDRDHEFPAKNDIPDYIKDHPTHRVLHERALESYIYNLETAKLWLLRYELDLPSALEKKIVSVTKKIRRLTYQGVAGNGYKEWLVNTFHEVYMYKEMHLLNKFKKGKNSKSKNLSRKEIEAQSEGFFWELVDVITPETETYKKLCRELFLGDFC